MVSLPDHLRPTPVGTERLPKEVLQKHQRDRVLDAAVVVFAERGYSATTVDDIVAAAHIGVGSFYSLLGGREECFLALYDRTVAEARREIATALPVDAPWPERFCAGLRRLLELVAADPDRARVVVVEANTAGAAGERRYAETLAEIAAVLAGARLTERPGGGLPASFESATAAGLAWLLHQRLAAGGPVRVEELLPEMTRIVLEPYPA